MVLVVKTLDDLRPASRASLAFQTSFFLTTVLWAFQNQMPHLKIAERAISNCCDPKAQHLLNQ